MGGFGRAISISYLGLTREQHEARDQTATWRSWYDYFPWEDRRDAAEPGLGPMETALHHWVQTATTPAERRARRQRSAIAFGLEGRRWNEELVLQRYELLYEARLVPEAQDGGTPMPEAGKPMRQDHRRILATAIARLRAKITYRPVVFELMPPQFTLLDLQRSVEALAGPHSAQAEFPPPRGTAGAGRGNRRHGRGHRRPPGKTIPLPRGHSAGARLCRHQTANNSLLT